MNLPHCPSSSVTRVLKTLLVSVGALALSLTVVAQDYIRAPLHTVDKKNATNPPGYYPSDVEQVMLSVARSISEPNRIYAGQDVGSVWVSLDSGQSWSTLRNRGLGTPNIFSLAVDPADANIVYVLCGRRHYDNPVPSDMGVYRTLDGGITWTQVYAYPDEISEVRGAAMKIALDPNSVSGGRAQKIYITLDSATLKDSAIAARDALLRSTNGGNSFSEVRRLPAGTFGTTIRGSKVDPNNANRLYLWGSNGLLRINDVNASATSITNLSATNLPDGPVYGEPYVSSNGQTIIVGVEAVGVYKSTDGGTSFSVVHAYTDLRGAWVNSAYPNRIYLAGIGSAKGKYSTDGAAFTLIADSATAPMPGESDSHYHQRFGNYEPVVLPNPGNAQEALIFANANFQRTLDGGVTWDPANEYFAGTHHKNMAAPQMFDPVNPQRYVLGFLDKGIAYTEDGGRSFTVPSPALTDVTQVPTLSHTSVNGIALHPDAARQLILASVGSGTKGRLLRSVDNGTTWTAVIDTEQPRRVIGFDAGNNAYAYQWRERSSNYGSSWSTLANMPDASAVIVGISRTAYSGKSVLYAAKFNNGSTSPVWRSLDRGDSWQLLTTAAWDMEGTSIGAIVFRVHPTDPFIFFTRSSTNQIRKWVFNAAGVEQSGSTGSKDFSVGTMPSDFDATNFAVDPTNTNVMYLRAKGLRNDGNFLFRSTDGGDNWSNISAGFPNSQSNGLEVHPVTGVVYLGTTNGMFVRQRATGSPVANNTYDLLKTQYPSWIPKHLEAAYDVDVALEPVADSFTYGGNTSQNNGSLTYVSAKDGSGTASDRIIYLKFDLSGLGNYPTSATLALSPTANTQAGTVTARGLSVDSWVEGTITWANQPSVTGAPAADTAAVTVGQTADALLDVTSLVQQQYLGDKIVTIAITGDAAGLVSFTSRNGPAANRPILLLGQ